MSSFYEIIKNSLVCLNLDQPDGAGVIRAMLEEATRAGVIPEQMLPKVFRAVMNRELSASTAIPDGIALPHGRTKYVKDLVAVIGIHHKGAEFSSPDGKPTRFFFLLLVPISMACAHIQFLANLGRCLEEPSVRVDLLAAKNREAAVHAILSHVEEGK